MKTFAKRTFDIVVALVALTILSPIIALTALLVRINLGSPVLFRQTRPGIQGRPFQILKFRSMLDSRNSTGELLSDEQRLTRFGRILRSTSLDEFPQLVNVLRGELSLVGPRPLLMEYLPLYSERQARRHLVRPGITGLAQVSGRNALSWEEKFELDVWYVENHSLWLDLKILFRTIAMVVTRRDVSAQGHATTPLFDGTNSTHAKEPGPYPERSAIFEQRQPAQGRRLSEP